MAGEAGATLRGPLGFNNLLVDGGWSVRSDFPLRRTRIIDTVVVSVRLLSGLGNCFVLNFFCSVVHLAFVIGVMTLYTFQAAFHPLFTQSILLLSFQWRRKVFARLISLPSSLFFSYRLNR